MVRFEYDYIEANKLILEFKCEKCHSLTKTELLNVPELDFDNELDLIVAVRDVIIHWNGIILHYMRKRQKEQLI